jgi:non-specific serine/threonine protein kinase
LHLHFIFTPESFQVDDLNVKNKGDLALMERFQSDKYASLYALAFQNEIDTPTGRFLTSVAKAFVDTISRQSEIEVAREETKIELDEDIIDHLLSQVPFAIGSEFINEKWLRLNMKALNQVFHDELKDFNGPVSLYFEEKLQDLKVAKRIYFHLVDYLYNEEYPFAFMATYATKDAQGRIRHRPLEAALTQYKKDQGQLIALLSSLNKASSKVKEIRDLMDSGELFHPIRLTVKEAYALLKQVPVIESCGIKCRVPNWWKRKQSSIGLSLKLGEKEPSLMGLDSLLNVKPSLEVNGHTLTKAEIQALLKQEEGLTYLNGNWVEVNHKRLEELLEELEHYDGTMSLKEALTSSSLTDESGEEIQITNGEWLRSFKTQLRKPETLEMSAPDDLQATLRPYQVQGYKWLSMMNTFGFGACLADDMGLGKTLQVISFLEKMRESQESHALLIVPASLLGNWESELKKFAPHLDFTILHTSRSKVIKAYQEHIPFLTITTYGLATKIAALSERKWDALILDEAQAIKNPKTKQSVGIKKLSSRMRIAMTGTPIENDYSNLWSLFDFLNKGLLGTLNEFKAFTNELAQDPGNISKLRAMVSPFILRRLKTDSSIIKDLPDKVEVTDHIQLSKKQVALYNQEVDNLKETIVKVPPKERRGLVLKYITRFKQICNHPDQFAHDEIFKPSDSGKFEMLKDVCEIILEKRERVLVFTQYKELCEPLSHYLESIFHKKGLIINGSTPVKKRQAYVEAFNGETYIPYMVLTVKAAGTGLNLTGANHVIHFDRWWNPAVENQASDRAYRIGQTKKVIVHKFVCTGTIEEKVDEMIAKKQKMANDILASAGENWITDLDDRELVDLFTLEV